MIPDPFKNDDPLWEPFDLLTWRGAEFSQPDLTSRSLKDWLRSEAGAKEFQRLHQPAITGFPRND
jgi:hypothetical protein